MSSGSPPPAESGGVRWNGPVDGVARITLDRPEVRNAQDKAMTYALDACFAHAGRDREVKVVILDADGPHFSSGHDLRDRSGMDDVEPVGLWGDFDNPGVEGYFGVEQEIYLGMCWRWRNLPKPTIAAVQGRCIAGGLMLAWVCDLIVAADDASFSDPTVAFGVNGVEYFAHPWELGPRRAKELLFTGEPISAHDARALGMVNHVVPAAELRAFTTALATRIAQRPSWGLKLAKQSVNQAVDAQGFWPALQAAFSLQHLGHAHNTQRFGMLIDPAGLGRPRPPADPQEPKRSS